MAGKKYLAIAFLIIAIILTSGCFEEHLTEIIYDEYVQPTLPPIGVGSIGQKIFTANCAGCHGINAQGILPNTPDFSAASYWSDNPEEEVLTKIKDGVDGTPMPGWSDKISEDEIVETVNYMKSIAGI
jgi:mono/diheme cytochrome c family protein